ncbi:MAG: haloacid dehalogenase, partial [Elusimicrobia bacterium]|nr:haloacid dehalogenase [Elusimicrobiota bacterium]
LRVCGRSAAVADALPALKEQVDFVTARGSGGGAVEVIGRLLENDLKGKPL